MERKKKEDSTEAVVKIWHMNSWNISPISNKAGGLKGFWSLDKWIHCVTGQKRQKKNKKFLLKKWIKNCFTPVNTFLSHILIATECKQKIYHFAFKQKIMQLEM